MELSTQRSAASSLQGLNRSRPQASLLPPATSFHGKHVVSQLQQVLGRLRSQSGHVIGQFLGGDASHAAVAAPHEGVPQAVCLGSLYQAAIGTVVLEWPTRQHATALKQPFLCCCCNRWPGQAASVQPSKARQGSRRAQIAAAKQVAAAAWERQDVQPQHAEAELLEGGEATVANLNQVADLETILQERDACGVGVHAGLRPASASSCRFWSSADQLVVCCVPAAGGLHRQPEGHQEPHHCRAGGIARAQGQVGTREPGAPVAAAAAAATAAAAWRSSSGICAGRMAKQAMQLCGLSRPSTPIDSCRSCGCPPDHRGKLRHQLVQQFTAVAAAAQQAVAEQHKTLQAPAAHSGQGGASS